MYSLTCLTLETLFTVIAIPADSIRCPTLPTLCVGKDLGVSVGFGVSVGLGVRVDSGVLVGSTVLGAERSGVAVITTCITTGLVGEVWLANIPKSIHPRHRKITPTVAPSTPIIAHSFFVIVTPLVNLAN